MKQLEDNMLLEMDQVTNSSEKARDTIMQLQEELMNEFDVLSEKTDGGKLMGCLEGSVFK